MMAENIDVSQQLALLIKLQEIDAQIYKLNAEKDAKPQEMEALKGSLLEKESIVKEAEQNFKNLQLKRKEKEIELETAEASIKKLQAQLYQLKTNKEYQAMQHEIESHKADNSLLEEEILKLMESIDTAEADVKRQKGVFADETNKVNAEMKKIEARIEEINASLAELSNKREFIAPSINPRILKDYERILAGKSGLALVEVANDACGGCYMNLPPQVINEIKMQEHIVYCESCRRILYLKEEGV